MGVPALVGLICPLGWPTHELSLPPFFPPSSVSLLLPVPHFAELVDSTTLWIAKPRGPLLVRAGKPVVAAGPASPRSRYVVRVQ
ncbi:unnamed protein product [Dovyalis caffra]|uniref:Secreted protein n=1 Tax=Dovyalis caffra TaxID=77055 RepID=A0AAV1SIG8_9ROSI|nr:unnamed protein product [Dovyalis caffra]